MKTHHLSLPEKDFRIICFGIIFSGLIAFFILIFLPVVFTTLSQWQSFLLAGSIFLILTWFVRGGKISLQTNLIALEASSYPEDEELKPIKVEVTK